MAKNRKYQHRSRETVEGFIPVGNEAFSQAMREKNQSNAVRRHRLLIHKKSRRAKKSTAIREQREL